MELPPTYPPTRKSGQGVEYHGQPSADRYDWREECDAPESQAWIEAQNRLTFAYLEQIPAREPIRRRMTELWDYPKMSAPFKKGGSTFQFRNSGLQSQDVLWVRDGSGGDARILLDPNMLSADGTVALNTYALSKDGAWLAYAVTSGGSDWLTWRV